MLLQPHRSANLELIETTAVAAHKWASADLQRLCSLAMLDLCGPTAVSMTKTHLRHDCQVGEDGLRGGASAAPVQH